MSANVLMVSIILYTYIYIYMHACVQTSECTCVYAFHIQHMSCIYATCSVDMYNGKNEIKGMEIYIIMCDRLSKNLPSLQNFLL